MIRLKLVAFLSTAALTGGGAAALAADTPATAGQPTTPATSRATGRPEQGVTCKMLPAGIRQQESGGRYQVYGVPVRRQGGARALGAYQIMPANLPAWSQETVGRRVGPAEFMRTPALQDRIAGAKLARLCRAHGPRGAAAAWFSGRPELHNDSRPRGGGAASVKAYVDSVMALARRAPR